MAEVQDLSELIAKKMQQTVKNKQGQVIVNEDGMPMTTMEAIAMSIVQNAMKGDAASIVLVRNLTKRIATQEESQEAQQKYESRVNGYVEQIKKELEGDNLWFGQQMDVEYIAKTMCVADRLEMIMQSPDFEDMIVEIKKDGTQTMKLNPIHERYDEVQAQVRDAYNKLRLDASKKKQFRRMNNGLNF